MTTSGRSRSPTKPLEAGEELAIEHGDVTVEQERRHLERPTAAASSRNAASGPAPAGSPGARQPRPCRPAPASRPPSPRTPSRRDGTAGPPGSRLSAARCGAGGPAWGPQSTDPDRGVGQHCGAGAAATPLSRRGDAAASNGCLSTPRARCARRTPYSADPGTLRGLFCPRRREIFPIRPAGVGRKRKRGGRVARARVPRRTVTPMGLDRSPRGAASAGLSRLRQVATVAHRGQRRAGKRRASPLTGAHLREVARGATYESLTLHQRQEVQ